MLATNNIRPWELSSVFRQVLRDFLSQKDYNEDDDLSVQPAQLRPMEAWTSRYKMKQGFVTPTVPNCGDHPREEIPTISGYVDRAMRHSSSFTACNRDWDLPYYYPVPLRPTGTYSTTLWEDALLKTSAVSRLTQRKTVNHIHSIETRWKNLIVCIRRRFIIACDQKCEDGIRPGEQCTELFHNKN